MRVLACMKCGSGRIHSRYMLDGPITYTNESFDTYECEDCGFSGMPMSFDSEKERETYVGKLAREMKD